jgi:Tyrosine phosphatase family
MAHVPPELIGDDYTLSGQCLTAYFDELRRQARQTGHDMLKFERLLACGRDIMLNMVQYAHSRYGGIEGYLDAVGITSMQLGLLRAMLVGGGSI